MGISVPIDKGLAFVRISKSVDLAQTNLCRATREISWAAYDCALGKDVLRLSTHQRSQFSSHCSNIIQSHFLPPHDSFLQSRDCF